MDELGSVDDVDRNMDWLEDESVRDDRPRRRREGGAMSAEVGFVKPRSGSRLSSAPATRTRDLRSAADQWAA